MSTGTRFQPIFGDETVEKPSRYCIANRIYLVIFSRYNVSFAHFVCSSVEKVVFVSGKLYYDLVKERESRGLNNKVALVRIEVG
jgi:2-oxoglutarate dehydrogenase complex dehydrogenase (E1) component-like enzyme